MKKIIKFTSILMFAVLLVFNTTSFIAQIDNDDDLKLSSLMNLVKANAESQNCTESDGEVLTSNKGFTSPTTMCYGANDVVCGVAFGCEEDTEAKELPPNQLATCFVTVCAD
ncbi:hypothetical protein [Flavivirga rizhaonensis]|uniref:Uncharacterized protein n=1 Tax=Flavivirga rizhaonensis TaxID=2559571 RepID=A0A4S1DYU1_9FLAO|nr:hypothetical protein [Flavivirga rizhaonensis]TGV03426.1 hypothetical protein EM932_07070 [Flavivirga rizhaonensis]